MPVHAAGPNDWADNLKGIILAFTFALIFRAFVIEGFEIPTGSMAPTLMGQHTLMTSPTSGAVWPVGPKEYFEDNSTPRRTQTFATVDPLTGATINANNVPLRGGDRVFILKYLFPFYTPSRFDVAVFKNPRNPTMNYIKRLIGLGPEEIALVDGDVFVRPLATGEDEVNTTENTWLKSGWQIASKREESQRVMWQHVYDSAFTPINTMRDGRVWYRTPWKTQPAQSKDWEIEGKRELRYNGTSPSTLSWDNPTRISDYYAYNPASSLDLPNGCFPVSDVRLAFYYDPAKETSGKPLSATLTARGHQFRWSIFGKDVTLDMRASAPDDAPWVSLGKGILKNELTSGATEQIEFWHADQTLSVYIGERQVAIGKYDWNPDQRLRYSYNATAAEVWESKDNILMRYERIKPPQLTLSLSGAASLGRVTLDRDIHYQPNNYFAYNDATPSTRPGPHSRAGQPAAATHPRQPVFLAEGEYFMCGDNSPASLDARLWDAPYGWVARNQDKTAVIGRDALIGHAFIVYWPGMYWKFGRVPLPDMGRVRQIQ